jgi:hypothetical protein
MEYGRNYTGTDAWVDRDGTVHGADTRNSSGSPAGGDREQHGADRDSWAPIDLGPYLRGEIIRPEPTVGLFRRDGLQLLYPGKEHTVIGEMESGKSWYALGCAAAVINTGRHVVYVHFEEADPSDTVERLVALGVRDQDIDGPKFQFRGPERGVKLSDLAKLLDPVPALVILDGVNEAMALHGWGIRDEDGAAAYRRCLVKPCTRSRAAVLSLDHVVKDAERRTRTPLGSIHKGNGLTGSLIELVNAEPFGRGQRGRSHVYVNKDRPGYLRRNGRPTKTPGITYMGELVIDDTHQHNPFVEMTFYAPTKEEETTETPTGAASTRSLGARDDDRVYEAVLEVRRAGHPATVTAVRAVARMSNTRVSDALTRLDMAERLDREDGPRNSKIYTPTATGSQDQNDD